VTFTQAEKNKHKKQADDSSKQKSKNDDENLSNHARFDFESRDIHCFDEHTFQSAADVLATSFTNRIHCEVHNEFMQKHCSQVS
jgi:uncharacterized glyoxalase superfamily protein PhnB